YVNSCHSALPRRLNAEYDGPGGDTPSGVLLHTKFLPDIIEKSKTEKLRRQHFHDPNQFGTYYDQILSQPDMWTPHSVRYTGWSQLLEMGLMRDGGWS
ncbi:glycosyltransferase family 2 protein, partial [Ruegeria sp. NA]|nr:glycosyltransferase family 2 protein [Ruegeria sp. NA]